MARRAKKIRLSEVFLKIHPIKALFWASVINGVLAPFLLIEAS
jgi:hypothetical protein